MMMVLEVLRVQPRRKKDEQMIALQLVAPLREAGNGNCSESGLWELKASFRMERYVCGERFNTPGGRADTVPVNYSILHRGQEAHAWSPALRISMWCPASAL